MKKKLNYFFKEFILFLIGGLLYFLIEIISRGFSHWTMMVVGGICFVLIGLINEFLDWNDSLIKQDILAATIILIVEFFSGIILNIILKLNIWDYSNNYFNLLGQICLKSYIYWLLLSPIGIVLDDYIRYYLFKEEKPHYKL